MARAFHTLNAVTLVLLRDNIDTDAIIPSREIRAVGKTGLADGLFANWRYLRAGGREPDPTFVLNNPAYRGAQTLIAGENFGCGSSREQAVWALSEYGVRAVLAGSFNTIFHRNCLRNGVLPVELARTVLEEIARWVARDPQRNRIEVDLTKRMVVAAGHDWPFEIDDDARACLLEGLDEIERTLKLGGRIGAFRDADRMRRPWVYELDPP